MNTTRDFRDFKKQSGIRFILTSRVVIYAGKSNKIPVKVQEELIEVIWPFTPHFSQFL